MLVEAAPEPEPEPVPEPEPEPEPELDPEPELERKVEAARVPTPPPPRIPKPSQPVYQPEPERVSILDQVVSTGTHDRKPVKAEPRDSMPLHMPQVRLYLPHKSIEREKLLFVCLLKLRLLVRLSTSYNQTTTPYFSTQESGCTTTTQRLQ